MTNLRINLRNPSRDEYLEALNVLDRYGIHTRQEILLIATNGTAANPRRLMRAAGQIAMTFFCHACNRRQLNPADKDAMGLELCRVCLDEAEMENAHNDGYHDDQPMAGCHLCHHESGPDAMRVVPGDDTDDVLAHIDQVLGK